MDPLDWVHQWDQYEMYMYAELHTEEGTPGIYMQVSRRELVQGAEEWSLLYERRLGDLPSLPADGQRDEEDRTLRAYLNQHPNIVPEEKQFLLDWLSQQGNE